MIDLKKRLLAAVCICSALAGAAQPPAVTIPGSEVRRLASAIVAGQEYELQIMLPAGYQRGGKKYPVVYLMDAQWDFPLVTALYGQQYYDGFLPKMIVVGVTWGGLHPNPDSLRARDYTPTKEARLPQSGGADAFLRVLEKEVFPFVEKNYEADANDRILMGCSLGGLFTLYALFTQPALFQRYVAASPAVAWDNGILSQYAKTYFSHKENPPARLFLCVGGVERGAPVFENFVKELEARKPFSLQIQSRVLENTGHSGTKGEGYARGLQFIFQRPKLVLEANRLKNYTGRYLTTDGGTVEIREENNGLALYLSPVNKYTLYAAGSDEFYADSEFLNLHFTDAGFQLERYGGTQLVTKIQSAK